MSKTFIVDNYSKPFPLSSVSGDELLHRDLENRNDIVLNNPSFLTKHIVLQSVNYQDMYQTDGWIEARGETPNVLNSQWQKTFILTPNGKPDEIVKQFTKGMGERSDVILSYDESTKRFTLEGTINDTAVAELNVYGNHRNILGYYFEKSTVFQLGFNQTFQLSTDHISSLQFINIICDGVQTVSGVPGKIAVLHPANKFQFVPKQMDVVHTLLHDSVRIRFTDQDNRPFNLGIYSAQITCYSDAFFHRCPGLMHRKKQTYQTISPGLNYINLNESSKCISVVDMFGNLEKSLITRENSRVYIDDIEYILYDEIPIWQGKMIDYICFDHLQTFLRNHFSDIELSYTDDTLVIQTSDTYSFRLHPDNILYGLVEGNEDLSKLGIVGQIDKAQMQGTVYIYNLYLNGKKIHVAQVQDIMIKSLDSHIWNWWDHVDENRVELFLEVLLMTKKGNIAKSKPGYRKESVTVRMFYK